MRGPAHRSPGAPVLFSCPCIADFEFPPQAYGDRIASVYDALISPSIDASTAAGVSFLAELAGDGPALELGVGTGRVALPLASRGVQVHGIDSSEAMVARMRSKPHGDAVTIHIGDFADVAVDDQFRLIYVVFNTVFAILTQADQVRCFRNVAARLPSGGCFVIEAFGPDPTLFDRGQRVSATRVELERVQLDVTQHDPVAQRVTTQHLLVGKEGIMLLPVQLRYAWPSELDLMAQLAGLELDGASAAGSASPSRRTARQRSRSIGEVNCCRGTRR